MDWSLLFGGDDYNYGLFCNNHRIPFRRLCVVFVTPAKKKKNSSKQVGLTLIRDEVVRYTGHITKELHIYEHWSIVETVVLVMHLLWSFINHQ